MNRAIEAGAILLLAVMFFSGPIADTILANAIGPEGLELPHVAYPMGATAEWTQTVGGQGEGLDCRLPVFQQRPYLVVAHTPFRSAFNHHVRHVAYRARKAQCLFRIAGP